MQIFFKNFSFCQKNGVKWCEIWSTIIDNWQQLFWGGQQLSTITNNLREVMGPTIINN